LLIPLSSTSSRGDQQRNARIFAEHGASRVLDGDSVTAELLFAEVTQLLEHEPERKRMAEAAAGFDAAGAAGRIAAMIQDAVERGGWTS
jgi:UDP-N-acetylglucosamine--N-acetylmuramyl-(pentapeptide) pyrophosphoryl-undecaprenol N-acetylglucosamine transferase